MQSTFTPNAAPVFKNCALTVPVEQPCDCAVDSPDHSTVAILLTFGGRTYPACYHYTSDANETKTLCIPAGVPISNGGAYTITFVNGNGGTVVQTGVILVGGDNVALCEKTDVLTPQNPATS